MELLRRGTDLGSPDATIKNMCDSWTDDERKWHKRTMQLAHYMAGLGLTPHCASGIAAFYHSTARFIGWLAQLDAPDRWLGHAQKLDHPDTWTAANLVALGRTHSLLIQEFNFVESAQDPHADPAAADDDDERDGDGPRPAAPLPLPPLNTLASLLASEDEDTKLPEQRRVTLRSCAIGRSTRPSKPCYPTLELRKCTACTRPRNSMPSPAQMTEKWAIQSSRRTCLMTRTTTCEPKQRRKL